jgi:hypothetical protein
LPAPRPGVARSPGAFQLARRVLVVYQPKLFVLPKPFAFIAIPLRQLLGYAKLMLT